MSIECPNISDTSRLDLKQARDVLGIRTNRTVKKYAALMGVELHTRKADGKVVMYGKDVKKIWIRLS